MADVPRDRAPFGFPAWSWSLLVLLLGVVLSLWAASRQHEQSVARRDAELERIASGVTTALRDNLRACGMLLRSVQTVFLASNEVTAQEFSDIYRNLRSRREFPNLQALAYARRSEADDGEHFVTAMYAPVSGNASLIGLDVRSQAGNYVALQVSRDSDEVMMSAPFELVQSATNRADRDGVTLRLPVFSPGEPPQTMAERRVRLVGSIAASFRIRQLIADAIPEFADGSRVTVSEAAGTGGHLLYDSRPGSDDASSAAGGVMRELHFGGRTWQVRIDPLRAQPLGLEWQQSLLWPGLLASVLLALLVWSVATTRRRALELGWRMSHRFRESEQRFRTLNDLLPALVLMADSRDGSVIYANEAARARLGHAVSAGARIGQLFEDETLRRWLQQPRSELQASNVEARLQSLQGDRFWAAVSITRVPVGDRERLLMVASDISEQRQLTELLGYQASHDALTELYNRREFERCLLRTLNAAAGAPPGALLYLDLDQFKLINDTSGHLAGDQLLSQLALAMAGQLRPGDILARLGGDEFGVLAQNTDSTDAMHLAERLRTRIEGHIYVWEGRSYTISASIGVVMIDRPGLSLGEAMSQADTACYMAKDYGRNRIHFYSEQDDDAIRRRGEMEWATRLRWVIDEGRLLLDYQELHPLQQPVAEPHLELLLRLRDEDGREVLPGAFLPAAERYGMIAQIDRWVIAQATANFARLHASGCMPGRCALNLSAATLEDDDLADYVLGLIERHGIDPWRLCFEITETVAVRHLARATHFIGRLREVGCLVALDDFGAGMSSFGYLKNLPVDVIKIDGSFVRDLDGDPMSRTIVEAISRIGHQRGVDVVAEWVASQAAVGTLRELGVDYAQGYAMHRPERVLYQRDGAAG